MPFFNSSLTSALQIQTFYAITYCKVNFPFMLKGRELSKYLKEVINI